MARAALGVREDLLVFSLRGVSVAPERRLDMGQPVDLSAAARRLRRRDSSLRESLVNKQALSVEIHLLPGHIVRRDAGLCQT
jgi:hypothetical protein